LSISLTKAQQVVTANQSTSTFAMLCIHFHHLLNNCASVHGASVTLVWIVVHALFRHIVGLTHLSSLHKKGCTAAKQGVTHIVTQTA